MKIELEIKPETIANMFTSAIESGDPVTTAKKGGWCSGIYYHDQNTKPPAGIWYCDKPKFYSSKAFKVEIVEVDDETKPHVKSHFIYHADLLRGLKVMAEKFPDIFAQVLKDDTDAPCADIFLQCILFGEEKYA